MLKHQNVWLGLLLLALVFASCREIVTTDFPNFDKQPVVNSFLAEGEEVKVQVSLTDKLDSLEMGFVTNATVDLYVDDRFSEQLAYSDGGWYCSTTKVEALKSYKCLVVIPGFDTVQCTQFIPQKSEIIKVEHINIAGKDEEGTSYPAITVSFLNKPSTRAYYEVVIHLFEDSTTTRSALIHTIADPIILNEGLPIALFSNESITDSTYTLYLNYKTNQSGSKNQGPMRTILYPLMVELRTVSYDYYRYKKQLYLYNEGRTADGITGSMINTNLHTNIEGGYGIFSAYASVLSDTIQPNTTGYYE